jgi:hypothetical protein
MSSRTLPILVLMAAASPVGAQSVDDKSSQCSFQSATTCWAVWGPRATPASSTRRDPPSKPELRDSLPALAEIPVRRTGSRPR